MRQLQEKGIEKKKEIRKKIDMRHATPIHRALKGGPGGKHNTLRFDNMTGA